jgi:serine/threonine protein kinase
MNFADIIGQTLDEKYKIESELGRGGMGTVYLATHLGTERPVAVKIIAPQFMKRPEFVERFRREARAAGRLRHPNVVDVTDFGFADSCDGRVAYLVMEYLDGCTLGEILEEENNLPVGWTLDILEQVCSAVHEAHEQGIIHRDLKPDNIWLEPNQRGGYTVKVLDFGIAKLEEHGDATPGIDFPIATSKPTHVGSQKLTMADHSRDETIHDSISPTRILESATMAIGVDGIVPASELNTIIQPVNDEPGDGVAMLPVQFASSPDQDTIGTKVISESDENSKSPDEIADSSVSTGSDLTRVGAVLGTPLYMSPEQCRGEKLDARSDIYSLGVIAYQMLSGDTPFTGDFTDVMAAHKELPPPPLKAKKVRKKLKRVISTALAKSADDRPQTAEAFASSLRSRSEGIWALLRRAGMIYTEHMPKFLMLSAFFSLPMVVLTFSVVVFSFLKASDAIPQAYANALVSINLAALSVISAFCAYLIVGTITWIVTQSLAVPLRPIKLRASLKEARKKWKTFAGTGIFSMVLSVVAAGLAAIVGFIVPFLIIWPTIGLEGPGPVIAGVIGLICGCVVFLAASVSLMLVAPVVMMENIRGWAALKRSTDLIKRSVVTAFAAFVIMFLIPAVSAGLISFAVNVTAKAFGKESDKIQIVRQDNNAVAADSQPAVSDEKKEDDVTFSIGNNRAIRFNGEQKDMQSRLKDTVLETLMQIFLLPIQIVATSFTAIIVALLYLKTRQAGGESLQGLLSNFEETERPRKKWQERVRQRLIQSGRITSRS